MLQLLDQDNYSFKSKPPAAIRAVLYDYDFTRWNTSWARRIPGAEIIPYTDMFGLQSRNTKPYWFRTNAREYLPPLEKDNPSMIHFLKSHGLPYRPHRSAEQLFEDCINTTDTFSKIGSFKSQLLKWTKYSICFSLQFRGKASAVGLTKSTAGATSTAGPGIQLIFFIFGTYLSKWFITNSRPQRFLTK